MTDERPGASVVPSASHHSPCSLEGPDVDMSRAAYPPAITCDVAEHLPDFALLALPDDELRRIDDHLQRCDACRAELSGVLDLLATMAAPTVAPPDPASRAAFIARACGGGDVLVESGHARRNKGRACSRADDATPRPE